MNKSEYVNNMSCQGPRNVSPAVSLNVRVLDVKDADNGVGPQYSYDGGLGDWLGRVWCAGHWTDLYVHCVKGTRHISAIEFVTGPGKWDWKMIHVGDPVRPGERDLFTTAIYECKIKNYRLPAHLES